MKAEHYRPTGRDSEIVYVPVITRCTNPECRLPLKRPHATSSFHNCHCEERSHYVWRCLGCKTRSVDPPCEEGGPPTAVGSAYSS